jgi:hypothetical protein
MFDRVLLQAYKLINHDEASEPIESITPEDRMINFIHLYDPPPEIGHAPSDSETVKSGAPAA